MNLSERGYRKIRQYEGYGKRLPDGRCAAYREMINGKLDIWTIGYGCTKGIDASTVWAQEDADLALKAEIAGHERTVTRLVTVDINQNEADDLVSFDFNTGGLAKSSILRLLNAGDREGAAKAFALWNKFGGKPCKALTARRADEAALFLERMEPAEPNTMPQSVEARAAPLSATQGAGVVVGAGTVLGTLPAPPPAVTEALASATAWSDMVHAVLAFGPWVLGAMAAASAGWWIFKGK